MNSVTNIEPNVIEIWKHVNITSSSRKVYPGSYLYKVVESDELPEVNQVTNQGRVIEVSKLQDKRYRILFLE